MIELEIRQGFYKGYRGIVVGLNPAKQTYSVHLEANGSVVSVPVKYTYITKNNYDAEFHNVPKYMFNQDGSVYLNVSDDHLQKDFLGDPSDEDNNIEDYIESLIDNSAPEYKVGYNEQYYIDNPLLDIKQIKEQYPKETEKNIFNIKQYIEDICAIVGIEPVGNYTHFVYSHLDKILDILNDKKIYVNSEQEYNLYKNSNNKINFQQENGKTYYIRQGLNNYVVVSDSILKYVTASYFYFYTNNLGIKSRLNLKASDFLEQAKLPNTNKNYYFACLESYNFFDTSKEVNRDLNTIMLHYSTDSALIEKFTNAINKLNPLEYNIMDEGSVINVQTNVYPSEKKLEEKRELVKKLNIKKRQDLFFKKRNFIKFSKVANKTDLTKRVKQEDFFKSLDLFKIKQDSQKKNIPIFKHNLYKLYNYVKTSLETKYKTPVDKLDLLDKDTISLLKNDEIYIDFSVLTSLLKDKSSDSDYIRLLEDLDLLHSLYKSKNDVDTMYLDYNPQYKDFIKKTSNQLFNMIGTIANTTSKIIDDYNIEYIKNMNQIKDGRQQSKPSNNDKLYKFTYDEIKNVYLKEINKYITKETNDEIKFVNQNYDRILSNNLTSKEKSRYSNNINHLHDFFNVNYKTLTQTHGVARTNHLLKYSEKSRLQYKMELNQIQLSNINIQTTDLQPKISKKRLHDAMHQVIEESDDATTYNQKLIDRGVIQRVPGEASFKRFKNFISKTNSRGAKSDDNRAQFFIDSVPPNYIFSSREQYSKPQSKRPKTDNNIDVQASIDLVKKYVEQ